MIPVWEGSILAPLSIDTMQEREQKTIPVTVQTALERFRNNYPLMPFIKQERSLENMAPDLKSVSNPDTQEVYLSSCFIENRKLPLCLTFFSWFLESVLTHWLQDRPGQVLEMQLFQASGYCSCYARVQVCKEVKNRLISGGVEDVRWPFLTCCHSSSLWMPLHVPQPSTKQTNDWKWCLITALLTPSVPFSKCQSTCSPSLSPACFLPSGERGSSSIYFAAQLKSPLSVQIQAKG